MQQVVSDPSVTWGDFRFCAYGLKDPESGLRSLKPTSLMRDRSSEGVIFSSSVKHEHQPLQGNAGTFGSRTKLAQVYLYQFCQDLAHILLRHLKVKPLDNEVCLLEDLFEPFTIKQVDILRKEMEAIDKEFCSQNPRPAVQQGRSTISHPGPASSEVPEDNEAVPTWDRNRYLQARS